MPIRCLPGAAVAKIVNCIAIGSAIAELEAEFADPNLSKESVETLVTGLAIARTIQAALVFTVLEFVPQIRIQMLQNAVTAALYVTLTTIQLYKDDARKLTKAISSTPKDGAVEEAKDISGLTPQKDDNPNDYDMVRDEL